MSGGGAAPLARELARLFDRDLAQLREEIGSYPDEPSVWALRDGILNSGGTLALHLCGNLQHFVGALLGRTGYVRDREAEFSDRDVPRAAILARIDEARAAVSETLAGLDGEALEGRFPGAAPGSLGDAPTTRLMLVHLSGHLAYHLGQVNYHRRLLARP